MEYSDYLAKYNEVRKYRETSLDNHGFLKQFYYHSIIDSNLIKLDSILKNGILSKSLLENRKLPLVTTEGCLNNDVVSLSEYNDKVMFSPMYESYARYVLSTISLMVDKNITTTKVEETNDSFDDELHTKNSISNKNIKGILLPEHLSNKTIDKVKPIAHNINCYNELYLNNWIEYIESFFGKKVDKKTILNSLRELYKILEKYDNEEKWLSYALKEQKSYSGINLDDVLANMLKELWEDKLKLNNPKYIDVVSTINENKYPIYEIGIMQLKKINK